MSSRENIIETVSRICRPPIESLGMELVQVVYQREADGWILRLLVDRDGGVTVEDCSRLSRELSVLLDVEDPVPNPYRLEVSSPGLDRPLVTAADYRRFCGSQLTLRTQQPLSGRRNFRGRLVSFQDDTAVVEVDRQQFEIPLSMIDRANLVPDLAGFDSRRGPRK